jgi:serine protease Do
MFARQRFITTFAAMSLAIAGLSSPLHAADEDLESAEERAFKQAAALVDPSVVRIQTVGGLDRVGKILTGTGPTTGVVVSSDGYIISSSFNFISKPASILVDLPDGRQFIAKVIASDRSKMLTLLKVDVKGLTPADPADMKSVKVGQWSIALGRTYDKTFPSISVGIIGALGRIWGKAIQTDAKVSPVNYGGPLVNIEGKVLGVLVPLSTRGATEAAGVEWYDSGIGFAIPMQDIYTSLDRLKTGKDLKPGLLGVTLKGRGLLAGAPIVDRVRVGSPAAEAGLKPGDVFTEVDGKPVRRQAEMRHVLGRKYAGEKVTFVAKRGNETIKGEIQLVDVLVAYESGFLGVLPARPAAGENNPAGVQVRHVYEDSPAAAAGLKKRDRIVKFGDKDVTDAKTLTDLVSRIRPKQKTTLVYVRDGASKTVDITLASLPNTVPGELLPTAIPPAAESDDEDKPKTGRFTETMPAHEHSYWAYVPEGYNPSHRHGLMVWLHPGGDTMEAAMIKQWKAICEQRGLILLAPKAEKIAGWSDSEAEFVKDAIEDIKKKYAIDDSRVFLHTFGDAGNFTFKLAFKYRELFRGVAAVSAPLRTAPQENSPEFRMQFHMVCGDKDSLYRNVQQSVAGLKTRKYPVSFTTVKGRDRKYPPAVQVQEIARWADALDRI